MFQRNHMVEVEELALNEERQKDHRQVLKIIDGSWEFHMWYFVRFVTICTIYKTWKTLLVKLQAEASHITVFNLNSTNFKALTRIWVKKVKSNKGHVPSSASIKFRWRNWIKCLQSSAFFPSEVVGEGKEKVNKFVAVGSYVPVGNYMFKVNNRNIRGRCGICSKLTIKAPERRQWRIFVS